MPLCCGKRCFISFLIFGSHYKQRKKQTNNQTNKHASLCRDLYSASWLALRPSNSVAMTSMTLDMIANDRYAIALYLYPFTVVWMAFTLFHGRIYGGKVELKDSVSRLVLHPLN